jgi:hypothetical protein
MKNGDVVYTYDWRKGYAKRVAVPFRYRFDPVPGIHKTERSFFSLYYKTPRHINEKKQWFCNEGFGRARRSPENLQNPWNDWPRADCYLDKSWKKSRKVLRQWQKNL